MKKFFIILGVILAAVVLFVMVNLSKPEVLAKVELGKQVVFVTNGNDVAWKNASVILNDAFAGPVLEVSGLWQPGEKKELRLSEFRGRMNKQAFKPDYEQVTEVDISVDGFLPGIYKIRQ